MPESLIREYRCAKRASLVGATCMYIFSCASLFITITFIVTFLSDGCTDENSLPYRIFVIASLLFTTFSTTLLGSFFRHFCKDPSPFGRHQSLRLLMAGLLFALRTALDAFTASPAYKTSVSDSSTHVFVVAGPGPDLKVVVMVVFLICLAMVIRYGNALKEDSDSIA